MAVIPTTFEHIVLTPSPTEIHLWKDAEFIKDFPDEFPPPTGTATKPGKSVEVKIKVGHGKIIKILTSFAASTAVWFALQTLVQVGTETLTAPGNRRRRRKKTEKCVKHCLDIIWDAKNDLDVMKNGRIETTDTAPRHKRKTKSRKTKLKSPK